MIIFGLKFNVGEVLNFTNVFLQIKSKKLAHKKIKNYLCARFLKIFFHLSSSTFMYAIVNIAGQQFKVSQGMNLVVHRLEAEVGSTVTFHEVLLVGTDTTTTVGTPTVSGASVTATVKDHAKGDKVIIFKKKRRKGYRVKNGHRDFLTRITIDAVVA